MNVIKPSFSVVDRNCSKKELIEKVARVCYKSEDKITDGSAAAMVERLIKNRHYAMLEHASMAFEVSESVYNDLFNLCNNIAQYTLSNYKCYLRFSDCPRYVVSGNMRAWLELIEVYYEGLCAALPGYFGVIIAASEGILKPKHPLAAGNIGIKLLQTEDMTTVERWIHEDVTIQFTVDRGITHEIVRHRDASFAQESTRYCNYSKGKFGSSIKAIDIQGGMVYDTKLKTTKGVQLVEIYKEWYAAVEDAEKHYMKLIELGCTPQLARGVLPNSLAATIVMTANLREWSHFLDLRAANAAHPQMQEIAYKLMNYFVQNYPNYCYQED